MLDYFHEVTVKPEPRALQMQTDTTAKPPDVTKFSDVKSYETAYDQYLEKQNFSLPEFKKGWGPFQAIEDLGKRGDVDLASFDVIAESRRIRDREFKDRPDDQKYFTKHDGGNGDARHEIKRWSDEEKKEKLDAAVKEFEKKLIEQKLDATVPDIKVLQTALKDAGLPDVDAQKFRDGIKDAIRWELDQGTLKSEQLKPNGARVGSFYVAAGLLTPEELQDTLKAQADLRTALAGGEKLKDLPQERQDEIIRKTQLEDILQDRYSDRGTDWQNARTKYSSVFDLVQKQLKRTQ